MPSINKNVEKLKNNSLSLICPHFRLHFLNRFEELRPAFELVETLTVGSNNVVVIFATVIAFGVVLSGGDCVVDVVVVLTCSACSDITTKDWLLDVLVAIILGVVLASLTNSLALVVIDNDDDKFAPLAVGPGSLTFTTTEEWSLEEVLARLFKLLTKSS